MNAIAPGFADAPVWVVMLDGETFTGTLIGATDTGVIITEDSEAASDGHRITSNFWLPWALIGRVEQHLHHRDE